MRYAEVYLHRHMVPAGGLAGHIAVVCDVLRASTTAAAALASGAECLVPFADMQEMLEFRNELPRGLADRCLLAGERGGLATPGLDLGNSPEEFTPERVSGRVVLFSTTNGTDALSRVGEAETVFFSSLVNLSATAEVLGNMVRRDIEELALVCSGTELSASLEDMLAAGLLLQRLAVESGDWELDDGALAVLAVARAWGSREREAMLHAVGGRNVMALGMEADIDFAARVDSVPVVPRLVSDFPLLPGVDVLVGADGA